ncbi:MAG: hypothetical protein ACP5NU_01530 [Methanomicrobiales archaeon]|jgi:hypothetical protein|nr:hypothetical protein [Burkholderiaceae bacterium]NLH26403.1 hypothetical protein [Methanomicrobiales archaeon]HNI41328.1 hypothetical protein [Methanoregulaceae archaeon]HNJ81358.1 hypothetical protein [Methanoregulaceae archaeon]HNL85561.1 hypothetical protein [Methanoregulaceae archaeon]
MKKIVVKKEEQDKTVQITFRFKSLEQFFDEDDPNPLPDKELTEEAEDAISGHLDEYRVGKPARLVIELPGKDLADGVILPITEAIRHHFRFRQDDLTHDLKIAWREGIYSLILMLVNIGLLLAFIAYVGVSEIPPQSLKAGIILAFLTIMNWATIWDTYEHFLYDYRNLARKRRIFRKITTIPIAVTVY